MERASDRRRAPRAKKSTPQSLRISFEERPGYPRTEVLTSLMDVSDGGCRVRTLRALTVGSVVYLDRSVLTSNAKPETWSAQVTWCSLEADGAYNAGMALLAPHRTTGSDGEAATEPPPESLQDYYELLQLNAKADPDTIHRVYRILAQRFHPDNKDTGDERMFRQLLEAYRVLSDPESRVQYDIKLGLQNQHRWKIFDQESAMNGRDAEKAKRTGMLLVLYTRRRNEPTQPAMSVIEMEDLLGCPKEHLEFGLWFLREKGYITKNDGGRYCVTAAGVEAAEVAEIPWKSNQKLLPGPHAA